MILSFTFDEYGRSSEYMLKLELCGEIIVLLRELPLTCEERQRLITYAKSFLPLWIRVLQISLDASIVVGGILLLLHLMKRE